MTRQQKQPLITRISNAVCRLNAITPTFYDADKNWITISIPCNKRPALIEVTSHVYVIGPGCDSIDPKYSENTIIKDSDFDQFIADVGRAVMIALCNRFADGFSTKVSHVSSGYKLIIGMPGIVGGIEVIFREDMEYAMIAGKSCNVINDKYSKGYNIEDKRLFFYEVFEYAFMMPGVVITHEGVEWLHTNMFKERNHTEKVALIRCARVLFPL